MGIAKGLQVSGSDLLARDLKVVRHPGTTIRMADMVLEMLIGVDALGYASI